MIYLAIATAAVSIYAFICMCQEELEAGDSVDEAARKAEGPNFAGQKGYGQDITDLMAETYRYENRQVWE